MSKINYLLTNLPPILTLIVLFVDSLYRLKASHLKLLRSLILMLLAVLCADSASWLMDGIDAPGIHIAMWVVNIIYFILSVTTAYTWFIYVCTVLYSDWHNRNISKLRIWAAVPMFIYFVILALTPFYNTIFTIDSANCYHRGRFILFQQILCLIYTITASVIALIWRRYEDMPDKRRYCLLSAYFIVFPAVGGILQMGLFGTVLVWPCATAAFLLMYINLQHTQISMDPLTELNNYITLKQFIGSTYKRRSKPWYFILVDIDHFHSINDRYGHLAGDTVLCSVAELLRNYFNHSRAFLARYGNDEFAVVLLHDDDSTVSALLDGLKRQAILLSEQEEVVCPVTLTCGFARCDGSQPDAAALLTLAEQELQREKARSRMFAPASTDHTTTD